MVQIQWLTKNHDNLSIEVQGAGVSASLQFSPGQIVPIPKTVADEIKKKHPEKFETGELVIIQEIKSTVEEPTASKPKKSKNGNHGHKEKDRGENPDQESSENTHPEDGELSEEVDENKKVDFQ